LPAKTTKAALTSQKVPVTEPVAIRPQTT